MDKMNGLSLNLEKNNIDKIKEFFPEAVGEGKINFDMLRAMLGDEVDDSREKYQFTWNGKAKSIKLAQTPSSATLRPCKDEKNSKGEPKSKYWDTTENLYIEGDNLEVLKQLQKTYYGKIKMFYIDPPYNTGNDFVYHDDFSNSIENYKEQTNQICSNAESNGRYHTDWLNMIYPRLILAKNLLTKDGLIYISIDDNELTNLLKICDEIFGSENHIANVIWQKRTSPDARKKLSTAHEYILIYSKNKTMAENNIKLLPLDGSDKDKYKNPDNDPKGPWVSTDFGAQGYRPNQMYKIVTPGGKEYYPSDGRCWKNTEEGYKVLLNEGRMWFGSDGCGVPRKKLYLNEREGKNTWSLWMNDEVGHTQEATQKITELFGKKNIFEYTKPVRLLERIMRLTTDNDSIVLDFFSGSATTAHAVMKLNAEDGGKRKFIMVQLPELCDEKSEAYKAGYKNICEIGEERIRRAGEQIKTEWEKEHPSDGLFGSDEKFTTDIGFKVFKLDSTNVNEWDPNMKLDEKELAMRLGEVFKEGRSKEDILYEIMLKYGVFDKQVEDIDVNGKTMYRVGKRYMIVCLEDCITSEDVKAIAELSPRTVIFNEAGFMDDNSKINAVYNLEKSGVEDIKCI